MEKKKVRSDDDDPEFQLAIYAAIYQSQLEAKILERKREQIKQSLSYQVLDSLQSVLIKKCKGCHHLSICKHWYSEDLYPFWRLRYVCKKWRDIIPEWLKFRGIILMHGKDPKFEKSFNTQIKTTANVWNIKETGVDFFRNFYIEEMKNTIINLDDSHRWWRFIAQCELVYSIKSNRSTMVEPIDSYTTANERLLLKKNSIKKGFQGTTKDKKLTKAEWENLFSCRNERKQRSANRKQ